MATDEVRANYRHVGTHQRLVLPSLGWRPVASREKYDRFQYVADPLMADLTNRHHHIRGASEKEVERRVRQRYPNA